MDWTPRRVHPYAARGLGQALQKKLGAPFPFTCHHLDKRIGPFACFDGVEIGGNTKTQQGFNVGMIGHGAFGFVVGRPQGRPR